jgi:hypothetical protein
MNPGDTFENYGAHAPSYVARLLRQWAEEHEDENYHEFVVPLEALATRVEALTEPIQFFVMRAEHMYATPLAEFYIDPRLEEPTL